MSVVLNNDWAVLVLVFAYQLPCNFVSVIIKNNICTGVFPNCEDLSLRSTSWWFLKYWRPGKWQIPLSFSLHVGDMETCPWFEQHTDDLPWGFSPVWNTKAKPSARKSLAPKQASTRRKFYWSYPWGSCQLHLGNQNLCLE